MKVYIVLKKDCPPEEEPIQGVYTSRELAMERAEVVDGNVFAQNVLEGVVVSVREGLSEDDGNQT